MERRSRFVEKIHILMQDGRGYPVCVVSDAEEQRGECEDIGEKESRGYSPALAMYSAINLKIFKNVLRVSTNQCWPFLFERW